MRYEQTVPDAGIKSNSTGHCAVDASGLRVCKEDNINKQYQIIYMKHSNEIEMKLSSIYFTMWNVVLLLYL